MRVETIRREAVSKEIPPFITKSVSLLSRSTSGDASSASTVSGDIACRVTNDILHLAAPGARIHPASRLVLVHW